MNEFIGARNSEARKRHLERRGINTELKLYTELHAERARRVRTIPIPQYPSTEQRLADVRSQLERVNLHDRA